MDVEPERHSDALEHAGTVEVHRAAGSVSWTIVGGPEDDMRHPPAEYPEDIVPGQWIKVASSPMLCLSQACEILDLAFDSDIKERDSLVALARGWMRAAEISGSIQAKM
jgi:hypothetical protein